jgi:hypothetical protein
MDENTVLMPENVCCDVLYDGPPRRITDTRTLLDFLLVFGLSPSEHDA